MAAVPYPGEDIIDVTERLLKSDKPATNHKAADEVAGYLSQTYDPSLDFDVIAWNNLESGHGYTRGEQCKTRSRQHASNESQQLLGLRKRCLC